MKSEAILHDRASQCANCGAAASGNFCPACGQETTLHLPSASEFLHEFVGHYVALEGKLWKTLGLLLFRPGSRTREYIEGRRVRYVQPLRLYLTFSILFFALFKYAGHDLAQLGPDDLTPRAAAVAQDGAEPVRQQKPEDMVATVGSDGQVSAVFAKVSPALGRKAAKFDQLSLEEKTHQLRTAFFSYAPYAMFCLMPVFAFYLKLLYLGSDRRYGEHLLFALHSNGFAFLMLSLIMLTPAIVPYARPALGVWLVLYLPTAMRRVYGGSRLATAVRWAVLMMLHVVSLSLAATGALALAFVA